MLCSKRQQEVDTQLSKKEKELEALCVLKEKELARLAEKEKEGTEKCRNLGERIAAYESTDFEHVL
jgi:hypothetical protein